MSKKDYSEEVLIQEATAELLAKQLGWQSVLAYNEEDFGPESLLGRASDAEVVLTREVLAALRRLNPGLPDEAYRLALAQVVQDDITIASGGFGLCGIPDALIAAIKARGVIGLFPANSVDDEDIELYDPASGEKLMTWHGLRQQNQKAAGKPNWSLADFVAPKESGKTDYLGAFAVTAGLGIDEHVARFEAEHDDYRAIMLKALCDRLAEAFTELMHAKVRRELWGHAADEVLTVDEMTDEKYAGIRPAPGYPACPDHVAKADIFRLLDAPGIGMAITESYAMLPTAAVSGFYFSHPQAQYFAVGKIGKDQVEDYAKRRGVSIERAEKDLAPTLGYHA